jgi:hypothetical protein
MLPEEASQTRRRFHVEPVTRMDPAWAHARTHSESWCLRTALTVPVATSHTLAPWNLVPQSTSLPLGEKAQDRTSPFPAQAERKELVSASNTFTRMEEISVLVGAAVRTGVQRKEGTHRG